MTELEKAARQALEALEYWAVRDEFNGETREAITTLRTAIEQAEKQEPLGYWLVGTDHVEFEKHTYHDGPELSLIHI